MYRIGYPFWKQAARMGIPMKIRVNVIKDEEEQVFVASSRDLPGLVCEAETMDELVTEVKGAINDLMTFHVSQPVTPPTTDLRFCAA